MRRERNVWSVLAALLWCVLVASSVSGAPVFFGPAPYVSAGNIPTGFYDGGAPTALENFEDDTLGFGITASAGGVILNGSGFELVIDSVDADDGVIDGSGSAGQSWFFALGATGVTFTFSGPLPTAAGMVWTDGAGTTTFEAFGPGMVSLGTIGPVSIADGSIVGTTGEDRFFGVQDAGGILAIKLSNTVGGIEMDHVQFGAAAAAAAVPGPSALALLGLGALGLLCAGRRRKQAERAHGRKTANTLSEFEIHDSRKTDSSGLRPSSDIAPARQNQFSSS